MLPLISDNPLNCCFGLGINYVLISIPALIKSYAEMGNVPKGFLALASIAMKQIR